MASSSADVLDEATTTLIADVKTMKEGKTPQQVEAYIHKLQSLGRHMQLQNFRTWLNKQCGLPIEIRPNNMNTKEFMQQDQVEQWITEWTQKNAKGTEQRVLRNFLRMDFAVQPNPKMQPCSSCEQPFMLFMLLPMKQHNMNTYDPDEHSLFCYNCCTEVGQMLHPGHRIHPDQQATERRKALNQNPPGMTMAECTWYLATPPKAAVPRDHAIILHRWDAETFQWVKLPLTKAGEDEASQYSPHEWHQLVHLVWQTRKAHSEQGLQTHRSMSLQDAIIEAQPNLTKRKASLALLDHQEFLATNAGTDPWTLEPQQLQRLVKAFSEWEKVNFTHMVTGHNNGLLDYVYHKDSIAHLQDFLEVVLPNLHQRYICRNIECSYVIKASHWINSATATKQGKYLCNNMGDLAIKVAELGIDDMDSLRATDITTFQENGLDNLSTRRIWESLHGPDIIVIHESEPATTRHDLPVVHTRGRGSMKRALDRTITNDEDQLIIDLENDMYAQSSGAFPTITPIHHQPTTEPEIACSATLGMFQQQFGYCSSSCCPLTPKQYQSSNLQKMATLWKATATPWGPADHSSPQHNMPQFDWQQHLSWTLQHYEQGHQPKPIDPTLRWAIRQQRDIPNIQQVRQDIIQEIQTLTTEWEDVTHQWFQTLPEHCKLAYRQPHMITQIPVLHHLLITIQYPHADILTNGFSLIGSLQPGLNWKVRTDNKYTETQTRTELHTYNRQYILKKLQQGRVDTHWQLMADEIAKEVQMGRMDGPFRAPKWWTRRSVPLQRHQHTSNLKPLPHSDPIIALAFSIEQTGSDGKAKIRRGEDWRRSGHNRSCNMTDQPYHHTPDHYPGWPNTQQPLTRPHSKCGDHDGAYRQCTPTDT